MFQVHKIVKAIYEQKKILNFGTVDEVLEMPRKIWNTFERITLDDFLNKYMLYNKQIKRDNEQETISHTVLN